MATFNNKNDVINQLKVFTSIKNSTTITNDSENSLSSLSSNKNDEIGYLLDIIVGTFGTTYLTNIIGGVLGKFIPTYSNSIRNIMLDILASNNLPIIGQTLKIPIGLIDLFGLFKNDPTSSEGLTSYPNDGFSKTFYNECLRKPNQNYIYNGLTFKYKETLNVIEVINNSSTDSNLFFNNLIPTNIVDSKYLISTILNKIFSTLNSNKSKKDLTNDIQFEKILDKLINNTTEDSQLFNFTDSEIIDLENELQNKIKGVTKYDLVCGDIESFLPLEDFNNIVNLLDVLSKDNTADLNNLFDGVINKSTEKSFSPTDNKTAIKDNFFKKFIKYILNSIVQSVFLSPLNIILLIISNPILLTSVNGLIDMLKNAKEFLKQILCNIKKILVDFIFNIFRKEVLKIVIPVFKQIVLEKKESTAKIVTSLATF